MKSFKIAIITGALALAAVITTIIVLSTGNTGYGLYISSVSGDVTISNTSDSTTAPAAAEGYLKTGDILTVNPGATCTLIYRTRDNYDENYIVLEPSTQVFATGKYTGKSDEELFLNRGSVIVSALKKSKRNVTIRTESASVTTAGAAMRISYLLDEGSNTTLAASFGGSSEIQMFDSQGTPVDRNGVKLMSEAPEILGDGLSAKVIGSSSEVPKFEYLNLPTVLTDYSASVLRELLTVSAFHELSFSAADIKAAYDAAPAEGTPDTEQPEETTTAPEASETTVPETTVTETESTEETTTVTTTEAPVTTTTVYTTTAYTTTQSPQTTAAETTSTASGKTVTVYIIIDDEILTQEVPYGGNATKPANPVIEGKKFIGWDGSFENITEETTISAIFEEDSEFVTTASTSVTFDTTASDVSEKMLTVTIVVNGEYSTQQVKYGGSVTLPAVNIPGYIFMGWDRSPDNITEDCTITAILLPDGSAVTDSSTVTYTVTFMVDGVAYPVKVAAGTSAVAPVVPTINSQGQVFIGWDTDFSNVNSDLVVTALFM